MLDPRQLLDAVRELPRYEDLSPTALNLLNEVEQLLLSTSPPAIGEPTPPIKRYRLHWSHPDGGTASLREHPQGEFVVYDDTLVTTPPQSPTADTIEALKADYKRLARDYNELLETYDRDIWHVDKVRAAVWEEAAKVVVCQFDERPSNRPNADWTDGYQQACRDIETALRSHAKPSEVSDGQ